MLDRSLIEREFPFLKDVIFLNAALVAIPPVSVQQAYFGFTQDYIATFADGVIERAWRIVEEARGEVAKLIGATAAEIGFVKNTSEGVGILANGFPFTAGDNVVVIDQEHPANLFAWIAQQPRGVELRVVPSRNGKVLADDILARIDDRTRVLALSAVQFSTGTYTRLERLGTICRERGILLAVDGIQAVGRLALDVKQLGVGYLSCGGNKGLLATTGAGFVFCDESWVRKIVPPYACYQSVRSHAKPPALTSDFSALDWHEDSRRFEAGNLNYAGIAAIGAGAKLLNALGLEEIERHVLALEEQLIEGIATLPLAIRSPLETECRSGILCIYYPAELEDRVRDILKRYRIYATFRGGYIRLCINFYNTRAQIQETVEGLREIAALASPFGKGAS
jgi:cysteine desulfurase/selenocysteine lyase